MSRSSVTSLVYQGRRPWREANNKGRISHLKEVLKAYALQTQWGNPSAFLWQPISSPSAWLAQ